jgi:hypothetical protein
MKRVWTVRMEIDTKLQIKATLNNKQSVLKNEAIRKVNHVFLVQHWSLQNEHSAMLQDWQ